MSEIRHPTGNQGEEELKDEDGNVIYVESHDARLEYKHSLLVPKEPKQFAGEPRKPGKKW